MKLHQVDVDLQDRSYPILIGRDCLATIGIRVRELKARSVLVVSDETVGDLYAAVVQASLESAGLRAEIFMIPAGEGSKSFSVLQQVCEAALEAKIERGDIIIALGGGVVGDLVGFAAAIVRRGLRFVQVPTSLLAQVDSSVGGKTGINASQGKNLIGAFHQPSLVLADTALLDTLPDREMRAGFAEILKYGLIDDAPFFEWCDANVEEIFRGGTAREEAIAHSCRAKAAIVARDEREDGERALLNLGHTFGHALERLTGYDSGRLVHGEAVAIGLCQAFRFSVRLGLCPPKDAQRVEAILARTGLPTHLGDVSGTISSTEALLDAMRQDKKIKAGNLTFILARAIGESFIAPDIQETDIRYFLDEEIRA
jgi:3-dehydroquinate synthase